MTTTTETILGCLSGVRVAVVGDVMFDRFYYGHVERVSPEAPALVMTAESEREMLGGAANVARNLATLGVASDLIGLVGGDRAEIEIRDSLAEHGIGAEYLVTDHERPSTTKIRFVSATHNTHLLRFDREKAAPVSGAAADLLLKSIRQAASIADAIVLSDYAKGVVTPESISATVEAAAARGIPVVVDPKGANYARYRGARAICPNLSELSVAVGRKLAQDDADIERAAAQISEQSGVPILLVKRSERGLQVVENGKTLITFPSRVVKVVDVSGAGDTVVAAFAACLGAGASPVEAARIANSAAGIVVGKPGTACASLAELREQLLNRGVRSISPKIAPNAAAMSALVRHWQEVGYSVGFTNGCFDLLHPGHVQLLVEARQYCDKLVIGLNSDASVRGLKGPTRPIQNETARSTVMAALEVVNGVVLFPEDTPLALLEILRPNVLFKGADYQLNQVVGRELVEAYGGRVVLIDLVPDNSTSSIVHRVRERSLVGG